jgi:hypothetical protein
MQVYDQAGVGWPGTGNCQVGALCGFAVAPALVLVMAGFGGVFQGGVGLL